MILGNDQNHDLYRDLVLNRNRRKRVHHVMVDVLDLIGNGQIRVHRDRVPETLRDRDDLNRGVGPGDTVKVDGVGMIIENEIGIIGICDHEVAEEEERGDSEATEIVISEEGEEAMEEGRGIEREGIEVVDQVEVDHHEGIEERV